MHDIDNVKKRIITSMIAILLLIFALFGITYAYFTAKVKGNTNDKSVDVSAGKLELTYGDGNGFIKVDKIQPGEVIKSKTFTVKNTGTGDIDSYEVILENVINELKYYNDLTYELECKSDIGTCGGSDDTFPIYDNSIITNSIKVGETHTYTLTLTYHETNLDQSDDMDKNIEAKVNIRDSEYNYNKLNIYGNTDGLGTLVSNDTDRFNGMYKVDIKSVGKNLFNLDKCTTTYANLDEYSLENNILTAKGAEGLKVYAHSAGAFAININNLKIPSNQTYTISFYVTLLEIGKYNKNISILIYDNNSKYLSYVFNNLELNKKIKVYYTFNHNSNSLLKTIILRLNNNKNIIDLNSIQIEKNDIMTDYEPYSENVYSIYIKEPLRCLSDVCDYVDLVNKKVIRKIKDDNGTLSLLDNVVEEKIQSIDTDILTDRNIVVDDATNVETEIDR